MDVIEPVICLLNLDELKIEVFANACKGMSPSQLQFTPDNNGFVFYGRKTEPFRLGSIFCDNRPGQLFFYNLKSESLEALSDPDVAILGAKFSPSGTYLTFFQRTDLRAHQDCFSLQKVNFSIFSLKFV